MLDHRGRVGGVMVHVVTVADLARSAMAAPVVGNDAIAVRDEVEHLRVPVVGAEGPAMMEHDRLTILRPPVLVENLDTVLGGDAAHLFVPFDIWGRRLIPEAPAARNVVTGAGG